MRLIDADKVEFKLYTPIEDENGVFRGFKSVSIVANEPTIDAVPVIRCKDCKHRNDIEFSNGTLHLCERFDKTAAHRIDDLERFCSWAERKEND